jgi:glycosyltransferase involved in cell wall biosynthesis
MGRARVLLLAEACNPEWTSVPLVGWNWYRHLRDVARVTLVTHIRNKAAVSARLRADDEAVYVDSERVAGPCYRLSRLLTLGRGLGWTTQQAAMWLPYLYFERLVYKRFATDLRRGRFDLVHSLTPLSPTYASPIATWTDVPFVLGPLNGGLPWPKGTTRTRLAEMEFLSYVRTAYRYLPYVRGTYARAAAVIAGSRHTQDELENSFGIRCHYMPENGLDPLVFHADTATEPAHESPFRILFVGRLVPYKGADVVLSAYLGSPLLREHAQLVIVGNGPQRAALEAQAAALVAAGHVQFRGAVPQDAVASECRRASVLAFPSIREFGGAVVMEAMACGLPCIVADHGGPSEYVTPDTGICVQVGTRESRIEGVRSALEHLLLSPSAVETMRAAATARARSEWTWTAKAEWCARLYGRVTRN